MMDRNENTQSEMPRLACGSHPPALGYDADIIILTRNRFKETVEAVDSALRQRNVGFHVSVLDQGSPAAMQAKFVAAFREHANFGYYASGGNLGVGGGRNFLSGLGAGKIIVALDNDAVFADDLVVASAVSLLKDRPALGVLGFRIMAQDGVHLDEFSWGYPARLKQAAQASFATTTFVGAGHAIARTCWVEAGGYDADLFFTWEEYDFALRAIALQWSILYAGQLVVIHKISPEARVSWDLLRMRLFVRNRIIVARKWNISWVELMPRIIFYLLKAARNRRLLAALAGVFEAISADRAVFKRPLGADMRRYLREHETRFHEGVLQGFYRNVIREMHADPK